MAAKLRFNCSCGKTLLADVDAAGKQAKCPGCGQLIQVPTPPPASATTGISTPLTERSAGARGEPPPLPSAVRGPVASGRPGPPPLPSEGKSIWDEVDEYRLAESPPTACPNCGSVMSAEAAVCIQCGYNRQTGIAGTKGAAGRLATASPPPRKKQKSALERWRKSFGGGSTLGARFGIAMIVFGVIIFFLGVNEKRLADVSSREPETISLKKLIERGPEGNPNIVLTDYQLCDNFVYEGKKVAGQIVGSWSKIWVPIVPSAGPAPGNIAIAAPTQNVQALIFSKHVDNQGQFVKLMGPRLRGLVTNRISSLGAEEKKFLKQGYPAIDFDRCLIIDEGREPSGSDRIALYLGGGAALVVVGGVLVARRIL